MSKIIVFKNLQSLIFGLTFSSFQKNLNARNKIKGEMMVSKARFKLLRKEKIDR